MKEDYAFNLYNRFQQFRSILDKEGFEIKIHGKEITLLGQKRSLGEILSGGRYLVVYNSCNGNSDEVYREASSKLMKIAKDFEVDKSSVNNDS